MNKFDNQLIRLEEILASKANGYVADAEACLADIARSQQPQVIERLLPLLDEAAPDELMFSIIHTVEQWDDDIYCKALLHSVRKLWTRAPRWAEIVHLRVMNSQHTIDIYLGLLAAASDSVRSVVKNIYETIAKNRPDMANQALSIVDQLDACKS